LKTRMKTQTKRPWSRGDNLLITVPSILAALGCGLFFWLRAANTLPAPLPLPHPMPTVNARDYYIAAADTLLENNKIGYADRPWGPGIHPATPDQHFYSLAAKEKLVAENARALSLLHQGFQFPYQDPPVRSLFIIFPQFQRMRHIAEFLSLDGQVKAAQGNWSGAVNTELDAVQMGENLPRGGGINAMYLGSMCQSIGRRHAWEAVPHLSGPVAQAATRRLEAIRTAHVPLVDTVQEEKWGMQAGLRDAMAQPDWVNRFIMDANCGWTPTLTQNPQAWAGNITWATSIQLIGKGRILTRNAHWMDEAIAQARQPYAAHPAMPPVPDDFVNQMLLSNYDNARRRESVTDTLNALLVTTLALQAYRQDHKAYPPTLAALAPAYLKAVPPDPFALSGPLRYKLAGAKYALYSVGPDGKDDGGKAIFDATQPAPGPGDRSDQRHFVQQDSTGDIVAGVNIY